MMDELIQASAWLRSEGNLSPLSQEVRRRFPGKTVFPVRWLPEQGEDIHWLLVGPTEVARIEIRRELFGVDGVPSVEIIDLQTYRSGSLSKTGRRMLDAAVELLSMAGDLR
ncbi:hypothetical protein [Ralstonia insidiosa]|uniref:Uncharacterized protein n=1 Tax=Ralstonia insidiosa TaxID=190721 RepID=A0A848P5V7_9RALS|nr:hypothetical protein [Ralstonia insidiosa]NMV40553.1 hypothetical protein [Ralstonia insidiosa]